MEFTEQELQNEIWKDISEIEKYKEFQGLYQISNLGRVKMVSRPCAHNRFTEPKITLGWCVDKIESLPHYKGYYKIDLKKGKLHFKSKEVHTLVALLFIDKPISNKRLIVDHQDGEIKNNRASNLRWVTYRKNNQNTYNHRDGKLVGVSWIKRLEQYRAHIQINSKSIYLLVSDSEEECSKYYQKACELVDQYNGSTHQFRQLVRQSIE